MEDIIQTIQLEFERSTFLLDVVKHTNGKLFVQIIQTIQSKKKNNERQTIKLSPEVLPKIIETLKSYQTLINQKETQTNRKTPFEFTNQIVSRYLKGISIKDLMIQFDYKEEVIKQILRNNEIEIVEEMKTKKRRR
jgi:hypothetical protein